MVFAKKKMSVKKVKISGIDFSLNSPCVATWYNSVDEYFDVKDVHFCLSTTKKKLVGFKGTNAIFAKEPEWENSIERYDNLQKLMITRCYPDSTSNSFVMLEGYSFQSQSNNLTKMGESIGILKYRLWHEGIPFKTVQPKEVKKFAGKGNADKEYMMNAAIEKFGIDFEKYCGVEKEKDKEATDIADSLWICYMLWVEMMLTFRQENILKKILGKDIDNIKKKMYNKDENFIIKGV